MNTRKTLLKIARAFHFTFRNLLRVAFLFTVLLCFAAGIAWFAVMRYFNAELLGGAFTQALQKAFNRPVSVGAIRLVSLNAVEIQNLRIIDTGFDFYNELLSVESVRIHYDIMAILRRQIVIDEVLLTNPAVSLIRDKNGVLNISGIKAPGKETASGSRFELTAPDGSPMQMDIEGVSLKGGVFSYRDLRAGVSHSLNGIDIKLPSLKFNAPVEYTLAFLLRNQIKDKIVETEVHSSGTINFANFRPEDMLLEDANVEIRGFRKPLSLTLFARDFTNPKIKLDTSLPGFSYDDVSLFLDKPMKFKIPALKVAADLAFSDGFRKIDIPALNISNNDLYADISAAADLAQSPARFTADFKTKEFELTKADFFSVFGKYSLKGKVSAQGNAVIESGKARLPKITVDLNGVDAKISNFDIKGVKARYEAEDNLNIMNSEVQNGTFKVGRQTITNIKGRAAYEHKKQNFYALLNNSTFNGQNVKMSVAISKVRSEPGRIIKVLASIDTFNPLEIFDTVEDFVIALSKGPATPRAKDTSDLAWLRNFRAALPGFMPNISGSVFAKRFESPIVSGANFNAEVDIRGLLPGMDKLTGKVDARLESGIIHKLQETADKYAATGIAFQPFVIMNNMERAGSFQMGRVLKDTPFERMTVSADFNNGKMDINNFYLDGPVIAATIDGEVQWVSESLDLNIMTMFKNTSKRGVLSENLTDESGEPALAFRAVGSMHKPSVQIKSPKKTGSKIRAARDKGLRTNFAAIQKFLKEK